MSAAARVLDKLKRGGVTTTERLASVAYAGEEWPRQWRTSVHMTIHRLRVLGHPIRTNGHRGYSYGVVGL